MTKQTSPIANPITAYEAADEYQRGLFAKLTATRRFVAKLRLEAARAVEVAGNQRCDDPEEQITNIVGISTSPVFSNLATAEAVLRAVEADSAFQRADAEIFPLRSALDEHLADLELMRTERANARDFLVRKMREAKEAHIDAEPESVRKAREALEKFDSAA